MEKACSSKWEDLSGRFERRIRPRLPRSARTLLGSLWNLFTKHHRAFSVLDLTVSSISLRVVLAVALWGARNVFINAFGVLRTFWTF